MYRSHSNSSRVDAALTNTVKLASEGTAIRDARFGIRRERKDAKGQQSLESAATLTLGSFSHGAREDIGGMEVRHVFGSFLGKFTANN